MDLSVIIPAFQEEQKIGATIGAVLEFFEPSGYSTEILVVDDGSRDGTYEAAHNSAQKIQGRSEVRVLRIAHQGKGAAVAEGVYAAQGRWILMTDVDLSTPLSEWPKLASALQAGASLAIGSRQAAGAEITERQSWPRQRIGILFGRLVRDLFPVGVNDTQCGFKAFEATAAKDLFHNLRAKGYCFDVEVILRARSRGLTVAEIPVVWHNDPDSRVRVWKDWPRVLYELYLIRREMADSKGLSGGGGRSR